MHKRLKKIILQKKCPNAIVKNRKILKRAMLSIPDPLPNFIEKVKEIKKAAENEDLFCKSCNIFLNSAQQLKVQVQSIDINLLFSHHRLTCNLRNIK